MVRLVQVDYVILLKSDVTPRLDGSPGQHWETAASCVMITDPDAITQVVFMAYMIVLKKSVNVGLSAVLVVFTAIFKILYVSAYVIKAQQF
jgi:hypothetical protein